LNDYQSLTCSFLNLLNRPNELAILVRINAKMHYFQPDPTPIGKGTPPSQTPTLGACGASILAPSALDQCPLHSKILDPPLRHRVIWICQLECLRI